MHGALAALAAILVAGGDLDLSWHSVDGGGSALVAGEWSLDGSVGQCDAGELAGGAWSMSGGFWPGATSATCVGDLDGSGSVDAADLAIVLGAWGPAHAPIGEDLDGDGDVDAADLAVLLGAWGPCG